MLLDDGSDEERRTMNRIAKAMMLLLIGSLSVGAPLWASSEGSNEGQEGTGVHATEGTAGESAPGGSSNEGTVGSEGHEGKVSQEGGAEGATEGTIGQENTGSSKESQGGSSSS